MRRPYRSPSLSERDRQVMEIERRWGPGPSALSTKLAAAREVGIDARTYALVVNALIDDPLAHAADPRMMEQLRNIRQQNRDARGSA